MSKNVEVVCPADNLEERQYIVTLLLHRFLGLDCAITFSEMADAYEIKSGDNIILIEDHFFRKYPSDLSYISADAVPESVSWFDADFLPQSLPIIYGRNYFNFKSSHAIVACGLDVFASAFFMLTRWEEYVLGREKTGKCDEEKLFCVRNGIYSRPIVNEYLELLSSLLARIGVEAVVTQKFSMKITHDVDRCYLTTWKEMLTNVRFLFGKGQSGKARNLFIDYCWYKLFMPYPFHTFSLFMDLSEGFGFKDEFYFKACSKGERGYTYSCDEPKVLSSIKQIMSRGHIVGFHPSESTFGNSDQFSVELKRLSCVCQQRVLTGRNHGLYVNTDMLEAWAANGFASVSNWGFQKRMGFRCGICYPFPLFDNRKRQVLSAVEYPFLLMDTVLLRTMPAADIAFESMATLIDKVNYYKGTVCINWHTNVYNMRKMMKYKPLYKQILSYVRLKMDKQ